MLTQLNKTRTDSQGRNYFMFECPDCKKRMEKRVDHAEHKCTKGKPRKVRTEKPQSIITTLLIAPRNIVNPTFRELKVNSRNKSAYDKLKYNLRRLFVVQEKITCISANGLLN